MRPKTQQRPVILLEETGLSVRYASMQDRYVTQAYVPPMTDSIFRLIVVFSAAFILEQAAWYTGHLSYPLVLQFGPEFHPAQLITHFFLNGSSGGHLFNDLLNFFFQMVILWSFGSELERLWGSYNFLRFFYIGLFGGLAIGFLVHIIFVPALIPDMAFFGISAGLAAVMTGYAMLWPERQILFFFFIPMRVKWLIALLFFLYAFFGVLYNQYDRLVLLSGGSIAGALFILYYAKRGRMKRDVEFEGKGKSLRERFQAYMKQRRLKKKQAVIDQRIEMKYEVDRLLEKISKQGMKSLSRREKRFLDKASREF